MGLCQKLDTIPASVDENDETLKNFYTSLGPALPIATLQWKIIIYKTLIMMYGRKLLSAIPHFTHVHWFSPFRIAIHRRIVQFFKQLIARIVHRGVSSAASTATWVMAVAGKSPN